MEKDSFLVIKMSLLEVVIMFIIAMATLAFFWNVGKNYGRELTYMTLTNVEQPSLELQVICERILYDKGSGNARRFQTY